MTSRSSTPGGASLAWTTILSRGLPPLEELGGRPVGAPTNCSRDGSGTGHVVKIFDSEDDGFEAPADLSWKFVKRELGKFPTRQVVRRPGVAWPPDEAGYLDLYSGVRGVARALVRKGASWCLCFDIKDGPDQNLGLRDFRARLEWLVCAGAFKGLGAGPDCSSFSVAVTPPVRNVDEPYGKKDASSRMQEKMRVGNDHALWVLSLCQLAVRCGVGFWVENPALSWLFRLPEWLEWLKSESPMSNWLMVSLSCMCMRICWLPCKKGLSACSLMRALCVQNANGPGDVKRLLLRHKGAPNQPAHQKKSFTSVDLNTSLMCRRSVTAHPSARFGRESPHVDSGMEKSAWCDQASALPR